MANPVLTLRELNRTLLQRQMLLAREDTAPLAAVERLIGLQAQIPNPPYIGLWTRLVQFERDSLTSLMEQRQIVRAAMMRSTLHLVSSLDHQRFRPVIEPALIRALGAFFGQRGKGLDIEKLVRAARPFLTETPRSTGDLRALLSEIEPDRDPDALAYAVRTYLPLVQIPPGGTWGKGSLAAYLTADAWLGVNGSAADLRALFSRYLQAFGPASVRDFQAWSGTVKLDKALEPFTAELRAYQDERGQTLFDLTDHTLTPADTPAPVRFVPEYDNLLLSHADRTRIIADADRPKVFLSAGRVRSTILVDGFVSGVWKIEREKRAARLIIEPFRPITPADQLALVEEGERLLRFAEDTAESLEVAFAQ